jgi:circadian clock protein KaiB
MSSASSKHDSQRGRLLHLRLYVAGEAPNSAAAVRNLRTVLGAQSHVKLEIVDVLKSPERGVQDGVIVTPTLVRVSPSPERRIVGNLRDLPKVAATLGIDEARRG